MAFGSGSIGGEAARRGLTAAEIVAASHEDVRVEQAKLDAAELRALERAEYYADCPPDRLPATAPRRAADDRGFVGRLRHFRHAAA
jgi:hypothetical protein